MPTILGIESTCDETAAAVVINGREVRSNVVATQVELHAKYRGVVPEIASRAHIENLLPVLEESLSQAGCGLADLDAIAVAHRPGLVGSLLIGVTAAKSLAWSLGKPLIAVDHVHAHLYSVMLEERSASRTPGSKGKTTTESKTGTGTACDSARILRAETEKVKKTGTGTVLCSVNTNPEIVNPPFPAVGMVCSGGHTAMYDVRAWDDVELIGTTIDDAVGEAYDKVAAILGLAYPGGPIIDTLAAAGDPKVVPFPRTYLGRDSLDFSFSGLKTAVLYHVRGVPGQNKAGAAMTDQHLRDVCASFQAACIDVITKKLRRALKQTGARSVTLGGGVSANRGLRAALANFDVPVHFPKLPYCTDNAAMSAGLADVHYRAGRFASLDLDAVTYSAFARQM
ncbi:MAG TPA: tRNA (adenosine(37)-N6)-threonylcarbamoyltransferase complex transferase subunit TsaD [Tepidisphaeraceae bacterium]|nr:tRNA (adenosine(37)-N6)-threonylcarbamoyltransferase complex transferase subunit TsaD [Tepidisphaeraceae bacterium]